MSGRRRSAAEWRDKTKQREEERVEELTLPSGFIVDARRPPIADWVKRKQIPSNLMSVAMDAHGTAQTSVASLMKGLKEKDIDDLLQFVAKTVQATVISPKIVPSAQGVREQDAGKTLEQLATDGVEAPIFGAFVRGQGGDLPPIIRDFAEDEMGADEISDEDTNFVFNWAMTGDGKGVEMGGGEVKAEDLTDFRETGALPDTGGGGAHVRGVAEPIAGG